MLDWSRTGITTIAYSIGKLQDGYDKLDTGLSNNNNIINNNIQSKSLIKRNLSKHITTIGTWNVRILRGTQWRNSGK